MPLLNITKTYADTQILSESDLDNILNSIEDFVNTTKLDDTNIQVGGISTANLAANAVTAEKLDEEDDYEMESLLFGDVDGPTLSKASNGVLLVEDSIQLEDSTDGPILSRAAADILLVADSIRLEDANGPTLSKSATDRMWVEDELEVGASGQTVVMSVAAAGRLNLSASEIALSSTSGAIINTDGTKAAQIKNSSGTAQGNILLSSPSGGGGQMIQRGSGAGDGDTLVTVDFPIAFTSTPTVVLTLTNSVGIEYEVDSASETSFTVQFGTSTTASFNWIAMGNY